MSQICYAPNAVPVPEYGPCNNNTDSVSLCCSPGQFCLTNGLCANGQGEFYSGACTDKTYKAAICPSFCMGASKFVVQCKDSVIPDGEFCCDANGSGSCCNSAGNALDLAPAVTSATVAPTANVGPTTSTSSSRTTSSSGPTGRSSLSSTTFSTGRITSFAGSSTGSTHLVDSTSMNSIPTTTTATLVSTSPSGSSTPPNKATKLGLELGLPLAGGLALLLILAVACCRKRIKPRLEKSLTMRRSRIVNHDPSDSEIKVEPIELGANPTRPVELDSGSTPRAPSAAPGLSASHENVERLAAISTPVPWDAGHHRLRSTPPPETPTLRSNNLLGPLPLPVFPTNPEDDSRGSSPPAVSAIAQTDGGSTPPPTQGSTKTNNLGEVSTGIDVSHIEQFDGPVSSDAESSEGHVPSNGIVAPPNSEAPSSTLVNSSPPSTKSYDSNTKTVLDVGCVLHTAETESEQGDMSPLSPANESAEENELSQYLGVVGWAPRHENAPTVVGGSEAAGSEAAGPEAEDLGVGGPEVADSEVASSESADSAVGEARSTSSEPVGEYENFELGEPAARGRSI